uniref:Transposase n=1 Tax=Neogobius melanostomus TaxID=47308 RepID=A0A8C6TNW3_9GOBI
MLATEVSWKPHGWRRKAPADHKACPPKRGRKRLLIDLSDGEGSSLQDPAAPLSDDESVYDSPSPESRPSAVNDADSQDRIPTINIGRQNEKPQSKASHKKVSDSMCQTELTMEDLRRLEDTVTSLDYDIHRLRQGIVDAEFNPEAFQDNEKTRFYTGLPNYSALVQIFHLCEPCMTAPTSLALSKFQQFIMVFMRLRLNLHAQDLAYRFKVSTATVSQIWVELINILHARLGSLVEWPERDVLQSAMPVSFRAAFGDAVAVIIDCFEVFIKKPANISARAQTHSNCKDRSSTVKFLIGIAPHGEITYISRAWGGMASNKQIAEECGVLNNLSPGDVVLADRGFNVEDGVGLFCASVYTKGKSRLSAYDSEQTRKLASVCVQVERVTGLVPKKYHILQSLPIGHTDVELNDSMALIDKIAVICCALSNLFKSIVPLE